MIRSALLGLAALSLTPGVADAATYTGTLNGVITNGFEDYSDIYNPGVNYANDLTGDAVSIAFTSTMLYNYTNPDDGTFFPTFVENTFFVKVPAVTNGLSQTYAVVNSDSYMGLPTSADFSGNAKKGSFDGTGWWLADFDFPISFNASYANASSIAGPLTGNGNVDVGFYDGSSINADVVIAFNLTDGFVSGGTPEPAAWALMILGFGAVGAMMRRQREANVVLRHV